MGFLWWGNTPAKPVAPALVEAKTIFNISGVVSQMKPGEKIALVLPGGGSFGRWSFGALYWLYQVGLLNLINYICGNSVGGLNTLLTSKYQKDMKSGLNVWQNVTQNSDIYQGEMGTTFGDIMGIVGQFFKDNNRRCILNPKGLYNLLDTQFGNTALAQLPVPVFVMTTDMISAERLVISSATDGTELAAEIGKDTSAIPIIFPSRDRQLRGKRVVLVDGGFGRNNPVDIAIKNGATKIILIGTSPDTLPTDPTMASDAFGVAG